MKNLMLVVFFLVCASYVSAQDSVPIKFKQGDVLSAEVLNTIFGRLNDVQRGFQSKTDIDGNWLCKTSSPIKNDDPRCVSDGLLYTKSGLVSFDAKNSQWNYAVSSPEDYFASCGKFSSNGSFDVVNNRLIVQSVFLGTTTIRTYVYEVQKINPTVFEFTGTNDSIVSCTKTAQPPSPPTSVSATVSASSSTPIVYTSQISWVDQSSDESGFKIQTKRSTISQWATSASAAANVTSSLIPLQKGDTWIRVLATNSNGDSITSNEVLVSVK